MVEPHCGHVLFSVPTKKRGLVVSVSSDAIGFGVGAGVGVGVGFGFGVGSGLDKHPENPITAMAPANARDLRSSRLPIFIIPIIYCST
ncbi:MAG: hypothetical protein PHY70_03475 [Methanocellales archaeon]|nr:hypothetical protein [Methanocellales archaeon]